MPTIELQPIKDQFCKDMLKIQINPQNVVFTALIDASGNEFTINKQKLIEALK